MILLGDCPIVATNFDDAEFLAEIEAEDIELHSGARPLRFLPRTKWPVLAEPPSERLVAAAPAPRSRSALEVAFGGRQGLDVSRDEPLLSVEDEGLAHEDVPARACPGCEFPLPLSIDHRPAVVIAVVGINRVGKTHLLAASLAMAYRQRALSALGCTEFVPDDTTSSRFMEDYFVPLFRRGEVLDGTPPEELDVRFRPLIFDVTIDESPFSLVMHDVAGEVLGDHRRRARIAPFLRGAKGMIFVVDPRDIDDLRPHLPDWVLQTHELGGWDQGALLATCLSAHGIFGQCDPIPVAVTIAKSDLLPTAVGAPLPFLQPAPASEDYEQLVQRISRTSGQVETFLEEHGAFNILGPAREYKTRVRASGNGRATGLTYHAVSALGTTPDQDDQLSSAVAPLNCVDPLAAILVQLRAEE